MGCDETAGAPPRLVGFYGDAWDDQGNYVGYNPVAWGLVTTAGLVVTIPADGTKSATLWESADDAAVTLEAKVDFIDPRNTMRPDA